MWISNSFSTRNRRPHSLNSQANLFVCFNWKKIIKTDLQLENIETIVELKSNIKRTSNCCDYPLFRFTMGGVWIKKGASRRFSKSGTQNLLMVYQLWTSAKKSHLEVSNHLRLGLFILLLWTPLLGCSKFPKIFGPTVFCVLLYERKLVRPSLGTLRVIFHVGQASKAHWSGGWFWLGA